MVDDIAAAVYEDLIGRKYGELDCWHLVLEMARRLERSLECYHETEGVPQAGDIVFIQGDAKPHVGMLVSATRMIHSSRGTDGVAQHPWRMFKDRIQMILRPRT